jgi:hypothetical protein
MVNAEEAVGAEVQAARPSLVAEAKKTKSERARRTVRAKATYTPFSEAPARLRIPD